MADIIIHIGVGWEVRLIKCLHGKYKSMRVWIADFEQHEEDLRQVAVDEEVSGRIDPEAIHEDKRSAVQHCTTKTCREI